MNEKLFIDEVSLSHTESLSRGSTVRAGDWVLLIESRQYTLKLVSTESLETLGYRVLKGDDEIKGGCFAIKTPKRYLFLMASFQEALDEIVKDTPWEGCIPSAEDSENLEHYAQICFKFVTARSMEEKRQR